MIGLVFINLSASLLYYDELLHAVAAQKMIKGFDYYSEVHEVLGHSFWGHRIPLMILYYVGPLKTYVLAVWFYLFGSSVFDLRLFGLLCGGLYLLITYVFVKTNFDKKIALLSIVILLMDPSFLFSRIFDWGPVAIQDLIKLILLFIGFKLVKSSELKTSLSFIFGVFCALLLWDKLNGWWWIVGLMIVFIYFGFNRVERIKKLIFPCSVGFILGFIPFIAYWYKRPWFYSESVKSFSYFEQYALLNKNNELLYSLLKNYLSDFTAKIQTLVSVVQGQAIPDAILVNRVDIVGVFGVLFFGAFFYLILRFHKIQSNIIAIYIMSVALILIILISPHANAIHHWIMLYPLPHIIVAYMLVEITRRFKVVGSVLVGLLLIVSSFSYILYAFSLSSKEVKVYWNGYSSRNIVNNLNNGFSDRRIYALDWGISLPVGYLSNGEIAVKDIQPFYSAQCQKLAKIRIDNGVFIRYSANYQVFRAYYENCGWVLDDLELYKSSQYEILH